jgi:hypothetical protein
LIGFRFLLFVFGFKSPVSTRPTMTPSCTATRRRHRAEARMGKATINGLPKPVAKRDLIFVDPHADTLLLKGTSERLSN